VGAGVKAEVTVDEVVLGSGGRNVLLIAKGGKFLLALVNARGGLDEQKESFWGGVPSRDGGDDRGGDDVGGGLREWGSGTDVVANDVGKEGRWELPENRGGDCSGGGNEDWAVTRGTWEVPSVVRGGENVFKGPSGLLNVVLINLVNGGPRGDGGSGGGHFQEQSVP